MGFVGIERNERLIFGGLAGVVASYVGLRGWEEALVLTLVIATVRKGRRKVWAMASVLLFAAAFPPWGWPTWLYCFTPLIVLWRDTEGRSIVCDVAEGVVIGFAMCWMTTGFVRDAVTVRGWLLQASGCLLFGFQMALFPIVLRRLGGRSVLVTAVVMAALATGGEWLQSSVMTGVIWSMTGLYLSAGLTPLAQWSALIGPLGVSAGLYFVNFLWLPELSRVGWRRWRWRGTMLAGVLLVSAWMGGRQIAASVMVPPAPFAVMLVQPHVRGGDEGGWRPWVTLDHLTRESLERDGPVDLIVWPESSLNDSVHPETEVEAAAGSHRYDEESADERARQQLSLQDFQEAYQPRYEAACLVGVPLVKRVLVEQYGLEITEGRRVNGACLVESSGAVGCHENWRSCH